MSKSELYDGEKFERNGRTYRVNFPYDDDGRVPWEDNDGHGIVTDWTKRDKKPGERVLCSDRSIKRFYDFAETMKKAKRESWGLGPEALAALEARLGRPAKPGDIVAQSVENDFEFLKSWCDDKWQYIGVVVTHIETDSDGEETDGESDSLWGVESNAGDYLVEVAYECADNIAAGLDDKQAAEIAESRPDRTRPME